MSLFVIVLVALGLVFDFLNGIRDSSNVVSTMIYSRAFPPRVALGVTALAEFSAPLIFGVAIAETIGNEIVTPTSITVQGIFAALISAFLWSLFTWYLGLPSSSSHALVGGLIGAIIIGADWHNIQSVGIIKVLVGLFASPIIGFVVGFIIFRLVVFLFRDASPRVNSVFKRSQIFTGLALAFSYGANDAQKTMGVITMALVSSRYLNHFEVPLWVIASCAGMIALGTYIGGWRLIKTLGAKFYHIRPIDGFGSQLSSAIVILGNAALGWPVSTTQVVSTTILGVGCGDRVNKVRWGVAGEILTAWLITIPSSALMAAGVYWVIMHIAP
jgi:PiT family inorganic phosphate transporter